MERDPDALLEIHAFVDGELDTARQLALERASATDAALRARVERIRGVRDATRTGATYHAVPAALRARVEAMAGPAASAGAAPRPDRRLPSAPAAAWTRWFGWRPLATAFAATVALSFGTQVYLAGERRDARLVDDVVASHVRSTIGDHAIDVASSDHHTVKPWLSSKLDYSPPVRDADLGGAVFVGGRVDYVDGRPVAALVYRQGQHLVDAFVWPVDRPDRDVSFVTERGYRVAHWTRGRMDHWVVSDVNRAEFADLVERLSSQPRDGD